MTAKIEANFAAEGDLPEGMHVMMLDAEPANVAAVTGDSAKISNDNVAKNGGTLTAVVAFVWDFDDGGEDTYDAKDTEKGIAGGDLTLGTLTVSAEQVD